MYRLLRETIIALVMLTLLQSSITITGEEGLIIITTFQNIADDVKQLICNNDSVYALVPSGIDPHDYQLTPNDYELLSKANIIVSTAHTHFELKIAELVRSGSLRSILVEIPKITGIKLLSLPNTDILNYHAITYDPDNYLIFITNLSDILITLRPTCREDYAAKLYEVKSLVNDIKERNRNISLSAVASSPLVQYAVTWLGIDIKNFVVREHGNTPLPADIIAIEGLLKNRLVNVVIVSEPGEESDRLLYDLAYKYSIPIIRVPSYALPGSTPIKLSVVVDQVVNLGSNASNPYVGNYNNYSQLLQYLVVVITAMIIVFSTLSIRKYLK